MEKTTTATARETLEHIVNQNVLTLANSTGELYYNAIFGAETINQQNTPELFNEYDENDEPKEILQWFIVTDWLANKLIEQGYCVMKTDDLSFYCRTQCGISIVDSGEFDFLLD